MTSAAATTVKRLITMVSRGDPLRETRLRLDPAVQPYAPLLRAAARIARGQRSEAWREVRQASQAAADNPVVRAVASRLLFLLADHRGALAEARAAVELGAASAATLLCHQARAIGWYHQAREVLERELRDGVRPAAHTAAAPAAADRRVDQALDRLLLLYLDAHHYEAAAAALDRYLPHTRAPAPMYLRAARVYERCGETDRGLAAVRAALAAETPSAATQLAAAPLLLELGAFDAAGALYEVALEHDPASRPALEALGRLRLWLGDAEGALAYARRLRALDPASGAGRRIEAAVRMLRGEPAQALPLLDAVLRDDPRDGEAYVWRAEAHLRLARPDEAFADAERGSVAGGHAFAARALHLLAEMQRSRPMRRGLWRRMRDLPRDGLRAMVRGARSAPGDAAVRYARQELAGELGELLGDAAAILAQGDAGAVAALLERALVAMRGNRTALATWVRGDGSLARLPRSTSARVASRQTLELIKIASPDETLRCFDELRARFPDSPMPLVHRGELQLWLGRYAEARADLEAAIAIHKQTRWAWYGLACLDLLAGDAERALATCAFGIRVMHDTEGPVALLCRGEAYRLLGRLDEAREQLGRACAVSPTRLSAWVNLALAHGAAGERAAQRAIFHRLARSAPALLSEAAFALGEAVFRAAVLEGVDAGHPDGGPAGETIDAVLGQGLAMMRGNRSSSCVTYFTSDGQIHHVPQVAAEGGTATDAVGRTLAEVRQLIGRAIERRG